MNSLNAPDVKVLSAVFDPIHATVTEPSTSVHPRSVSRKAAVCHFADIHRAALGLRLKV
jgi:hypothetical protein